ncbi:MAG: type II toxin-antitoxin system RelE/ParE family toxin [Gemmatimonadaceae bacterium]
MALYNVLIKKSAAKELEAVPEKDRRRLIERIRGLSNEPRPFGAEKLSGEDKYRVRQENFRILYAILDRELVVTVIRRGNRRDV